VSLPCHTRKYFLSAMDKPIRVDSNALIRTWRIPK
jgi:hypothetical protein